MQYKTENLEYPGSIRIHGSDNQLILRSSLERVMLESTEKEMT